MSAAALELAPPPPPAAAPPAPASPTASFAGAQPPKGAGREGFLDAVRTIATLRVVVWHAFGAAAITWVVAAMPAMFFVTGSLLAKSLDRRGARTVLADRSRRLAAPLWAFGLVAWLAMAAGAWRTGTGLPLARALAWAAPFSDPRGTAWEGGWLSSHLWYLRALVWLLLAAPLLLRAVRARRALTFTVAIGAVFALDLAARQPWSAQVGHGNLWNLGDFALYSVFLLAGFVHRSGAFATLSRRHWLGVAGVAGASAAGWALTQPVPLGVVNNSHPLHLFVGAAWLALALAFQGPIGRLASLRFSRAVIRTVGQRSLTVYLWHTAAIIGGVELLERFPPLPTGPRSVALLALTTLGTMAAMLAFGWIEDLADRRPARLWP
ncbi:MAG: acyltransferase family protein, partial [Acidimicrobiales bacterium]